MSLAVYLPSSHFSTIAGSILLAGGLVLGAQYSTSAPAQNAAVAPAQAPANTDWKAALNAIQATAPQIPAAPSQNTLTTLLHAAQSPNLTDTVARSLLVNLSSANSQGLGSDIPTQDKIIAAAAAQVSSAAPKKVYTAHDLTLGVDTPDTEHTYGNQVMQALGRHTSATSGATLRALTQATDTNDPAAVAKLASIQTQYEALVVDLSKVVVPKTLAPLHVAVLNDLGTVAASFDDLTLVLKDPLRGLQGLQQYQLRLGEVGRVFTSIAESLNKNGILFSKDEPGAPWSVFISP